MAVVVVVAVVVAAVAVAAAVAGELDEAAGFTDEGAAVAW